MTLCCVSNPVAGPYIGNAKWLGASLAVAAPRGPAAGRSVAAAVHVDRRVHVGHAAVGGPGRARRAGRGGDERGGAARGARVPGPAGRAGPVRVRVGLQVGRGHRGHHVPAGGRLLGAARLVAAGADQDRVADRRAGVGLAGRAPAGWRWPAWRGRSTRASRRSRSRWTAGRGTRPRSPRCRTSTPGGSGSGSGKTPGSASTPFEARATDKTGYTQTALQADVAPNGATGYPSTQITVYQ